MAKKREDRGKEKKSGVVTECNLDGDYISPIQSFRDLNTKNVVSLVTHSRYAQSLIILTIFGLLLRFYNLGLNSLWLDEASTNTFAIMSIPDIWKATAGGEFNPPLFYWLEHLMLVFGNNEFTLRFIPALLGVLTIPLIYFAGKEFMDRNVGIIAAAAFAFSPFLIYYSQEARAYSMMLFFVAFALVFYFKALKTNDLKNWALFGILSALAFWSHFYAFVIIASLILYALFLQVENFRKNLQNIKMIALSIVVFVVLCFPLILLAIQLFATRTSSAPAFGIQGLGIISETFRELSGFSDIPMFLLLILFIIGIIQAFLIDKKKGIFLVTLTVLTFVISFILSYKMPMVPRYLIFFNTIFFLGVAASYGIFYRLINNRGVVYGFMALLIIISAPTLATYYSGYSKDDWRGFSSQMQKITQSGDLVIVVPGYIYQPLNYYYSNTSDKTFEFGADTGKDLERINNGRGNSTAYFVVTGDISAANPDGDAIAWLKEHTKSLGQNTGIYLFVSA
ncbi:MAG: glycosyl transferase [Methanomicrobiales archaeon HGW-Methanomicrobiales-1]|jgi:4-amino-4-deoxy-L-arabinose transferase-like glycosyltransferase|nr:MAG: glycosyl transferase [Methanomicrobiales archaeon HGW-Methanomicrobiales-1]